MRKIWLLFPFILLLFQADSIAQSANVLTAYPALVSQSEATKNSDYSQIEYSFTLKGGLIFVEGRYDGLEAPYVLDTGAPSLIFNNPTTDQDSDEMEAYGISGKTSVQNFEIDQFEFAHIIKKDLNVYATDFSHLEKVKRTKIRGLIGYEAIKDHELMIDYQQQRLVFLDPNRKSSIYRDQQVTHQLRFKKRGHFPVVKVKIGKKVYHFGIDTGAEVNMIDRGWARRLRKNLRSSARPLHIQGIDKNKVKVRKGVIDHMEIDGLVFEELDMVLGDMSCINSGYQVKLDGILGYPFLKQACFSINYKTKILSIWSTIDPLQMASVRDLLLSTAKTE